MLYIMCHLRVLRVTCYVLCLCVCRVFGVRCVRSVFWLAFFFFGSGWGSGGYLIFHSIWHFICQQLEINTISGHQTWFLCNLNRIMQKNPCTLLFMLCFWCNNVLHLELWGNFYLECGVVIGWQVGEPWEWAYLIRSIQSVQVHFSTKCNREISKVLMRIRGNEISY
jgi:hypothetical protein